MAWFDLLQPFLAFQLGHQLTFDPTRHLLAVKVYTDILVLMHLKFKSCKVYWTNCTFHISKQ